MKNLDDILPDDTIHERSEEFSRIRFLYEFKEDIVDLLENLCIL